MPALYQGPVIDAHHHMWDLALDRHAWVSSKDSAMPTVGDAAYMRHNHTVAEYMAVTAGQNVEGSVHIEAVWDRHQDPTEETAWLDSLVRPRRIIGRYVAFAALGEPGYVERVEKHLASGRVAGFRESIRTHPTIRYGAGLAADVSDPRWLEAVGWLRGRNLVLELLVFGHQADDVCRLAERFPDQVIALNHLASPIDETDEGRALWRAGLRRMAKHPNVKIKISNYVRYAKTLDAADLRAVALPCIEAFGPARSMFGSDWPVSTKWLGFEAICDALRDMVRDFTPEEQSSIFREAAWRTYGFGD